MSSTLERWKSRHASRGLTSFVDDGPIDPARWSCANTRILFVNKEAHSLEGGDDLCGIVREGWKGPKYQHWHRLAEWAYGISRSSLGRFPDYVRRDDPQYAVVRQALLDAAFINVKKQSGGTSSLYEDIDSFVAADSDLIAEQVREIDPHVVIFGGTHQHFVKHGIFIWDDWTRCGQWTFRSGSKILIDFWHPSGRLDAGMAYFCLMALYQQALAHPN